MSGKQTYQQEEQIRRYLQDRMTEAERHAFEREMQRDPFLADAVEGFSDADSSLIFTDIADLRNRTEKPKKNRKFIWYAAASVLLLIVSSVILFNMQENVIPIVSESKIQEEVKIREKTKVEKSVTTPQRQPISVETQPEKEITIVENELVIEDLEMESNLADENKAINSTSLIPAEEEPKQTTYQAAKKVEFVKTAKNTHESFIPNPMVIDSSVAASGKLEKKADAMALDSEKLEEVVVVGYGIQKKLNLTGAVSSVKPELIVDGKASPAGGWEAFNEYLKTELQTPDSGSPTEKTMVRLSFVISSTGEKEQFEILKGKNDRYNEEAIRIIKDGPAWNPEIKRKTPQRSVVKLKLVFEP